jgi:hypothetical protein
MKNVSDRNLKLLDILLGPLEKTDPLQEINRIFKLYFDKLIFVDDQYLMNTFRGIVENKIYFLIKKDFRFYDLESYTEKYPYHLQDFLGDVPDSIEEDFIDKCISEQKSILNNTVKYFLKIENNEPINALQFVNVEFFEEFKSSSKRKIEFLQNNLNSISISNIDLNPYPNLFVSREVYNGFMIYVSNYIVEPYIDYSYLKKRLENDGLTHRITDKKFMLFIYEELNLISEKMYFHFLDKDKFSSLGKSNSTYRQNNFNLVFDS